MTIKTGIVILICLALMYPAYLWFTYIDTTVVKGSAYNFEIGSSKQEVYKSLPKALSQLKGNGNIFIQIKSNESIAPYVATSPDFDVMVSPLFHEEGFGEFARKDTWEFYFRASFNNVLKLEFCDDKLCKIHRHRKNFELP
ncbi:hypothetical protein EGC76_07180 [Pseudidiomarina gelatinasegens]|uniref:Uncharacterized protein n=1 Tax=Pseudidiomarina gelatinasegens TaxID=2487740 RepID=A0A451GEC8_9GAMM|nr:hypothetical protein [Pseudidiomarina gelatinasegens]RWU11313.1 hypothetical protein EGC76_07180 [Pseudidiomarina gelatinasegens]